MSTSQTSAQNGAVKGDKAARRQRFEDVFPVIAKELSDHLKGEGMPKDAVEWYERVRWACGPRRAC
jgi:farnesyl diphosphate synthase